VAVFLCRTVVHLHDRNYEVSVSHTIVSKLVTAALVFGLGGCAVEGVESAPTDALLAEKSQAFLGNTYLIDFDYPAVQVFPNGQKPPILPPVRPVRDGIDITSLYSGVTFSSILCTAARGCRSGHPAYSRFMTLHSSNGVSLFPRGQTPEFNSENGAVEATFATPVAWASIDAIPVQWSEGATSPRAKPWLEAYDERGVRIQIQEYPFSYGEPGWGTSQTMRVTGAIKRVRMSARVLNTPGMFPVYGLFDNLRYGDQ
jgi:hypothetical protein